MTRPFDRVVEAVAAIAEKLGASVGNSGNRLADNLEGIAEVAGGGGGASALIVELVLIEGKMEKYRLDHTWQEIHDAAPFVWLKKPAMEGANFYYPFAGDGVTGGDYAVFFEGVWQEPAEFFMTNSADGYPEMQD